MEKMFVHLADSHVDAYQISAVVPHQHGRRSGSTVILNNGTRIDLSDLTPDQVIEKVKAAQRALLHGEEV